MAACLPKARHEPSMIGSHRRLTQSFQYRVSRQPGAAQHPDQFAVRGVQTSTQLLGGRRRKSVSKRHPQLGDSACDRLVGLMDANAARRKQCHCVDAGCASELGRVQQHLGEIDHRKHHIRSSATAGAEQSIQPRQRAVTALHPPDGDPGIDHGNAHRLLPFPGRSRRRRSCNSSTRSRPRTRDQERDRASIASRFDDSSSAGPRMISRRAPVRTANACPVLRPSWRRSGAGITS